MAGGLPLRTRDYSRGAGVAHGQDFDFFYGYLGQKQARNYCPIRPTIEHPVSVARLVMEEAPHVMLVGEGALQFALDHGAEGRLSGACTTSGAA